MIAHPPHLLAVRTATPVHVLDQGDVAERARRLFGSRLDIDRLMPVFAHTGIDRRFSCVPLDWFECEHGWAERNALYLESALDLLERVTLDCLDEARLEPKDLDAIVVVSSTGIATPSLDALLIERLGLRRDVLRLPIFGLGCAGGVLGLARAAAIAASCPRVLFLVVELCSLTFRKNDHSKSNVVAAALFGDGAAGAILSTRDPGAAIEAWGEYLWPQTLDVMGWEVEDDGLKVRFAQNIPALVAADFRGVAEDFLKQNELTLADLGEVACHPGGAKVLAAFESVLERPLDDSRSVLRDYGNMSAASVMFVLERMGRAPAARRLVAGLGPGFTAGFLTIGAA